MAITCSARNGILPSSGRAIRTKLAWAFFTPLRGFLSIAFRSPFFRRGLFRAGPLVVLEALATRFPQDMPVFLANLTGLPSMASRIVYQNKAVMRVKRTRNTGSSLLFAQDSPLRDDIVREILKSEESLVILAGSDRTFPRQKDLRYPIDLMNSPDARSFWEETNKTIFVENLDLTADHLLALPGGVIPNPVTGSVRVTLNKQLSKMPDAQNFAFMSHRNRSGPQWETRRQASKIAEEHWSDFVHIVKDDIPPAQWRRIARKYTFGFCVEGGGLSPSPKFFDLLLARTIPIIRKSSISGVHTELPCVIVNDWRAGSLSRNFLEEEYQRIEARWRDWEEVFARLTLRYWWDFIHRNGNVR